MKKRAGGAFPSPMTYSIPSLKQGEIYNAFPDIRDPRKTAYYLPVIDTVYLPITYDDDLLNPQIQSRAWHEDVHSRLHNTFIGCHMRELAFWIIGMVVDFIMDTDDSGYQLLVPSLKMVCPNGEDDRLTWLASRYDELFEAAEVINEILAHTVQVEKEGYSRARAEEESANHMEDDELLEEFLDVYEQIGPAGSLALAAHVLNSAELEEWCTQDGLARAKVLERFQQVLRLVRGFKRQYPRGTSAVNRLSFNLSFIEHLGQNLPGYIGERCPLAGACLSNGLRRLGQLIVENSTALNMGRIFKNSGDYMGFIRCNYAGLESEINPIEESTKDFYNRMLLDIPELAERWNLENRQTYIWPLFYLARVEFQDTITIGWDLRRHESALNEQGTGNFYPDRSFLRGILIAEALRQQWWRAEGPRCFCYPFHGEGCPLKETMELVWKKTAPDPEWEEAENWKSEDPPECIKNIV
jgi:hypothetical protein